MANYYRGVIEDHVAAKSKEKGTPGIQFRVSVREKKIGGKWVPVQWFQRDVNLYFPTNGDTSWSVKKLQYAGYTGGSLSEMDLSGNTCELVSKFETYQGKEREKFDLALPPRGMAEASDEAALAIDAVLQSAPLDPEIERPEPIDPNSAPPEDAPDVSGAGESHDPYESDPVAPPDDDVPF